MADSAIAYPGARRLLMPLVSLSVIALSVSAMAGAAAAQTVTDYNLSVAAFPEMPETAPVAIPVQPAPPPAVQSRSGRRPATGAGQGRRPIDTLFQPMVGPAEALCRPLYNYLRTSIDRAAVASTAAGDICERYRVQPVIAFDSGSGEAIVTPPRLSDPNSVNQPPPPPPQGVIGP